MADRGDGDALILVPLLALSLAQDAVPTLKPDLRPQVYLAANTGELEANVKAVTNCKTVDAVRSVAEKKGWYVVRENYQEIWLETRTRGRLLRAKRTQRFAELAIGLPADDAVRMSSLPAALLEPIDMEMFAGSQRAEGDPAAILVANVEVTLSFGGREITHRIQDQNIFRQRAKLFTNPLIDEAKKYTVPKLDPPSGKDAVSAVALNSISFGSMPIKVTAELDRVVGPFYVQLTKAIEEAERDRDKAMDAFIKAVPDRYGKGDLRAHVGKNVSALTPDQSRGMLMSLTQGWEFSGFSSEKEARAFVLQAKITRAEPKLELMFGGSKGVLYSFGY